jgi:ankyrin repeat protein
MLNTISGHIINQIEQESILDLSKKAQNPIFAALVLGIFHKKIDELDANLLQKIIVIIPPSKMETSEAKAFFAKLENLDQQTLDRLLCDACEAGNLILVERFIQRGANIDAINNFGQTPLHLACENGHENVAAFLIGKGVNVDVKDNNDKTPFHLACENGHENVAAFLIGKGVNVDVKDNNGQTPFHLACENGHENVAAFLIEKGVNVDAIDNLGVTPLHYACYKGHENVAALLIKKGINVDAIDNFGSTPLHFACHEGHENVAAFLIEKGTNVDVKDNNGQTPLYFACISGNEKIVHLLIENGATIDAINGISNQTPLHIACEKGHDQIALLLLEKKANIDALNIDNRTPLHLACEKGHDQIAHLLIKEGANVDAKDEQDETPLHLACFSGNEKIALLLLEKDADLNAIDKYNRTPLHNACELGNEKIATLLIENGADLLAVDNYKMLPFYYLSPEKHHIAFLPEIPRNILDLILLDEEGNHEGACQKILSWKENAKEIISKGCMSSRFTHCILNYADLIDLDFVTEGWSDKKKFAHLSCLTPKTVHEIIGKITEEEREILLNQEVAKAIPSPSNELGVRYHVKEALINFANHCLVNLGDERSLESLSETLLTEARDLLNNIDNKTLAIACLDPDVQKCIYLYFEAMTPQQLKMTIPQLPPEYFAAIIKNFPLEIQIDWLPYAREEQIEAWNVDLSPLYDILETLKKFNSNTNLSDDEIKKASHLITIDAKVINLRCFASKLSSMLRVKKIKASDSLKKRLSNEIEYPLYQICDQLTDQSTLLQTKLYPRDSRDEYRCPISNDLIIDPVFLRFPPHITSRHAYDREWIKKCMQNKICDPLTNKSYDSYEIVPAGKHFQGLLLQEAWRIQDLDKALAIIEKGAPIDNSEIIRTLLEKKADEIQLEHLNAFRSNLERIKGPADLETKVRRLIHAKTYT